MKYVVQKASDIKLLWCDTLRLLKTFVDRVNGNFSPNHFHVNTQSAFSERKRVLSLAKILRPTRQKSIKFNTRRLINVQSQRPLIYYLFLQELQVFIYFLLFDWGKSMLLKSEGVSIFSFSWNSRHIFWMIHLK